MLLVRCLQPQSGGQTDRFLRHLVEDVKQASHVTFRLIRVVLPRYVGRVAMLLIYWMFVHVDVSARRVPSVHHRCGGVPHRRSVLQHLHTGTLQGCLQPPAGESKDPSAAANLN